jgi:4-aminobutyrate aminotransferase-like enzyme
MQAAKKTLDLLRQYESRNVTFIESDGTWPIVWERAQGLHVWDAEGRKYLDLTAAFGVAAAGHANPRVVKAGQHQMSKLLHAMGDVHPHALKAALARELSRITFERWSRSQPLSRITHHASSRITGKTIFCNSGFEAVEAALKTTLLATGKRGILAFHGAYHGLGYGALNATHRKHFRSPFRTQLGRFGHFAPYPNRKDQLDGLRMSIGKLLQEKAIGAILVEPVQARGGINIPPPGFLRMLRQLCDQTGTLLVIDEIYTGFGRTGKWFACEHQQTIPDVICLGKALTGGFPLSACVGRADLMDRAWPKSDGEAIHTSTYLGHPVGCAMALAQIKEIRERELVARSAALGRVLFEGLQGLKAPAHLGLEARGIGLMAGVELRFTNGKPASAPALQAVKEMLRHGYILLPEGEHSSVIGITPPLTISERQLQTALDTLESLLSRKYAF